jgi:hypothetical protein
MRQLTFAVLAVAGLCLTTAPSALAQGVSSSPYGYSLSASDLYAIPPGGHATRVYGPGTTFSYPLMYQSNNPYYAQRRIYTNTHYYATPYGPNSVYRWSR